MFANWVVLWNWNSCLLFILADLNLAFIKSLTLNIFCCIFFPPENFRTRPWLTPYSRKTFRQRGRPFFDYSLALAFTPSTPKSLFRPFMCIRTFPMWRKVVVAAESFCIDGALFRRFTEKFSVVAVEYRPRPPPPFSNYNRIFFRTFFQSTSHRKTFWYGMASFFDILHLLVFNGYLSNPVLILYVTISCNLIPVNFLF